MRGAEFSRHSPTLALKSSGERRSSAFKLAGIHSHHNIPLFLGKPVRWDRGLVVADPSHSMEVFVDTSMGKLQPNLQRRVCGSGYVLSSDTSHGHTPELHPGIELGVYKEQPLGWADLICPLANCHVGLQNLCAIPITGRMCYTSNLWLSPLIPPL